MDHPAAATTPPDAAATAALASLPASRRQLLELLKRQGEASAETLAAALGITLSGARQHLTALERDGLVAHSVVRGGPGRPKHRFSLTAAGDALFPRAYAELTNELLGYVEEADPALLETLFARRAARRLARTQARTAGLPFAEQVQVIAQVLDEDGYLADCSEQPDGSVIVTEHNCAVLGVALRYGHACSSELSYLQAALPDAVVTRVAHRLAGGHVCAYLVQPRPADENPPAE